MNKPDWWPRNPYPEDIFPMARGEYAKIVPDPKTRTALSGMLGREFWDIASEAIWDAMMQAQEDAEQPKPDGDPGRVYPSPWTAGESNEIHGSKPDGCYKVAP